MSWIKNFGLRFLEVIVNLFLVWIRPFLESFAEVFIVTLIGIAPFMLAVVRYNAVSGKGPEFDFSTVFASSFSGGQLYLYAFSMLGTLLWLSIFKWTVTDGKVLPALDAAHIKPYGEGGLHMKSNGILLRKDIHSVFDAGYVTINEDLKFSVSKKVKEVFNNGEEYLRLHGKTLRLPDRKADWPDVDLLKWHNNHRYLG